jgi:DNA-binding PadR family transcriptional regulator
MMNILTTKTTPESFIPLTPLTFGILTAVAEGPKSGYGIVRGIEEGSEGSLSPGTGTVYVALQRLIAEGLVEAAPEPPDAPADKRSRRWYAITEFGRQVLVLEARRLASALRLAVQAGVIVPDDAVGG